MFPRRARTCVVLLLVAAVGGACAKKRPVIAPPPPPVMAPDDDAIARAAAEERRREEVRLAGEDRLRREREEQLRRAQEEQLRHGSEPVTSAAPDQPPRSLPGTRPGSGLGSRLSRHKPGISSGSSAPRSATPPAAGVRRPASADRPVYRPRPPDPPATGAEPPGHAAPSPPGGQPDTPPGGAAPPRAGGPPAPPAPGGAAPAINLAIVAPLVVGLVLTSLIVGVAVFVPQPTPFQHSVFRAVLALGLACIAATVPGFSGATAEGSPGLAGVSGGLGAFLLVYFVDPMRRLGKREPVAAPISLAARGGAERSIFICYRRNDTEETVGRLYENLIERFGEQAVFKDVNAILAGLDYRKELASALQRCRIVLAIIGPDWEKDASGKRTIDQARDYVNIELSSALKRGVPLIPILVERRPALPAQQDLPPELTDLVYRQCLHLRPDPDFEHDFNRLIDNIEALLARGAAETAAVH